MPDFDDWTADSAVWDCTVCINEACKVGYDDISKGIITLLRSGIDCSYFDLLFPADCHVPAKSHGLEREVADNGRVIKSA